MIIIYKSKNKKKLHSEFYMKKLDKNTVHSILVGNTLEYYDFALYGIYSYDLSNLFFPRSNPDLALISTFIVFAVGFIMRPLGALFFGHLGDTIGRKKSLVLSLLIMAFPTFVIGSLPTYSSIGITAPIILFLCRLLQGFCAGGELSGAVIFLAENSKTRDIPYVTSLAAASGAAGALLGLLTYFATSIDAMPDWAWRIPFFFSILLMLVGLRIRLTLIENPKFLEILKNKNKSTLPVISVYKNKKKLLGYLSIGSGFAGIISSTIIVYLNIYMIKYLLFSKTQATIVSFLSLLTYIISCPLAGLISREYGSIRVITFGTIGIIFSLFLFMIIENNIFLEKNLFIIFALTLGMFGALHIAPLNAFISMLFPSYLRYTGSSLSYNIGVAFMGGTFPLVADILNRSFNYNKSFCIYIILIGSVSTIALWKSSFIKNKI